MANHTINANILILGSYNAAGNVFYSELETFTALQKKGQKIAVAGEASQEVEQYFKERQIEFYNIKPKGKFDKEFTRKIQEIIRKNKINILYARIGKYLRSIILFIKKENFKIVTYYGSGSLHWHDPSAYLSYLHPKVDYIICNSDFVYRHVRKQLWKKSKALKIYKGYDAEWFKEVQAFDYQSLNIPKETIKVILVGRNDKVKDIPTFLKSAEKLQPMQNIHFILVGQGLEKQNFQKISKGLKNIHFLGYRQDAPELIKGADVYVQTSLSEGLGRSISEAAAMGKPVVMTDAGGCTELVDPGESGYIVPIGAEDALAEKIQKLAENPSLREYMGKNAEKKIQTELNVKGTISDFYQFFQRIK